MTNIARNAIVALTNEFSWIKGDYEQYEVESCGECRPCLEGLTLDCDDATYSDQPSGFCMLGALGWAYDAEPRIFETGWLDDTEEAVNHPELLKAVTTVAEVIKEQFPDRLRESTPIHQIPCFVPSFNDHEDTTLSDVVLVLEKAAVKLDESVDSTTLA